MSGFSSSKLFLLTGIVLFSGLLVWFSLDPDRDSEEGDDTIPSVLVQKESPDAAETKEADEISDSRISNDRSGTSFPPHPEASLLGTGEVSPEEEVRIVGRLLDAYRESMGFYPTAEGNAGVVRQLGGLYQNRRAFIRSENQAIDEGGRLLDAYGGPYFFHFLSSEVVEIRSAGMDKELYTSDDTLVRKP